MNFTLLKRYSRVMLLALFVSTLAPGYAQTNCGDPVFPAPAEILANVPEASGFNLVYQLPIPAANQTWATQADIPYSVNNSAVLAASTFTRIAYYVKLESVFLGPQWVWISMDAFTPNLSEISIPTGTVTFQQQVSNMNVLHYSQAPRTGITGNIEFWSNCYNTANAGGVAGASDFSYDFGDEIIPGENCYGSFQIHDFNSLETILAYNGWAFAGATAEDLGIGNFPGANTDWTLADNAALYDVRELYVFVDAGNSFQINCTPASISLDASGQASITASMVTDAVIGNCGITDIALSQSSFNCSNLGDNSVTVTVTRNGTPVTCTATVTVTDEIDPELQVTGTTPELGCDPSAADIDAALGSATASDNCGSLVPDVVTDPAVLIGTNYSQTRHFTATDVSGNSVSENRTVTWPAECNVATPHIFYANVSCASFSSGGAPLEYACYTTAGNKVKKVSPKNFYYYAVVDAPAVLGAGNSFYVDVVQTRSCASFKMFTIQGNQIRAHDLQCNKVSNGSEVSVGQGRVKISNATPGNSYVISVKYDGKGIEGSAFSVQAPVCNYFFEARVSINGSFGSGALVAGSEGSLEVRPNCVVPEPVNVESRIAFSNELSEEVIASPNPSAAYFNVTFSEIPSKNALIKIYDANGRLMQTQSRINSTVVRIGENWKAGIYFAEIVNGSERKTLRLVKAK